MASVHVQYNSCSESNSEIDDYLGEASGDEDLNSKSSKNVTQVEKEDGRTGISDVMSKILGKRIPENENPVLARGQTDQEIRRRKRLREKKDENVKKTTKKSKHSDSSDSEDEDNAESRTNFLLHLQQRKEWEEMGRIKPTVLDKDKERGLQRIATRGVVQLFNAVRQQQNIVEHKLTEAGTSVRLRDKAVSSLSKKSFLQLLETRKPATTPSSKDEEQPENKKWSVLRDDFMKNPKMKDWDVDNDSDNK